jgi:hypothetical protein
MLSTCVYDCVNKNLIYKCKDMFLIECTINKLSVWILFTLWKYKRIESVAFSLRLTI